MDSIYKYNIVYIYKKIYTYKVVKCRKTHAK